MYVSNKAEYGGVFFLEKGATVTMENTVFSYNKQPFFLSTDVTANFYGIVINNQSADTPLFYIDALGNIKRRGDCV